MVTEKDCLLKTGGLSKVHITLETDGVMFPILIMIKRERRIVREKCLKNAFETLEKRRIFKVQGVSIWKENQTL